MPRKRRKRRPGATAQQPEGQPTLGWEWRTFPVFFAFVCGAFLMGWVAFTPAWWLVSLASMAGVAFGLAHIFTRWLAVRRARRQDQRRD